MIQTLNRQQEFIRTYIKLTEICGYFACIWTAGLREQKKNIRDKTEGIVQGKVMVETANTLLLAAIFIERDF